MLIFLSGLYFIVSLILNFYILILFLRLLFQKLGAPWYNPFSQFVIRFTEPAIRPLRKWIPGFKGFDLSIVFFILILSLLEAWLKFPMETGKTPNILGVLVLALGNTALNLSNIYFYAVIISALMSWFPLLKNNALGEIVRLISTPFVKLFQRFIPPISGMDFSPAFALLALFLMNIVLVHPLILLGNTLAIATGTSP